MTGALLQKDHAHGMLWKGTVVPPSRRRRPRPHSPPQRCGCAAESGAADAPGRWWAGCSAGAAAGRWTSWCASCGPQRKPAKDARDRTHQHFWYSLCLRLTPIGDPGFIPSGGAVEYLLLWLLQKEDNTFPSHPKGWIVYCFTLFLSIKSFEILIWQASEVGSFIMTVKKRRLEYFIKVILVYSPFHSLISF